MEADDFAYDADEDYSTLNCEVLMFLDDQKLYRLCFPCLKAVTAQIDEDEEAIIKPLEKQFDILPNIIGTRP